MAPDVFVLPLELLPGDGGVLLQAARKAAAAPAPAVPRNARLDGIFTGDSF
jgi:hypothetical protein